MNSLYSLPDLVTNALQLHVADRLSLQLLGIDSVKQAFKSLPVYHKIM